MTGVSYPRNKGLYWATWAVSLLAFLLVIYADLTIEVNVQLRLFLVIFSALTLLFLSFRSWSTTVLFLISTFTMLIAWRLSVLADFWVIEYVYALVFILKLAHFIWIARYDIKQKRAGDTHFRHHFLGSWQLFFIRIFVGFNLVGHFCEKLFAGTALRHADVAAFTSLGVPNALWFVWLAGICEFLGAFSVGCGFLTRAGSLLLFLYLIVATILGHHFQIGFIWASPGGGWEYPVLWAVIILTYIFCGADDFSLDQQLLQRYHPPGWVRRLFGSYLQ